MNKRITIVIPTKNEKEGVINVIKLLGKQRLDCEIIIADSSDDNGSSQMLHDYARHSPKPIRIVKGGLPSVARNNGAKFVRTPYVLFMDADIFIIDMNLINDCIDTAIDNNYDLVTCKLKTINGEYGWVYRIFDMLQWVASKTSPFAAGGFMLFKTQKFRDLGGFDNEAKFCEDYLLSKQIEPSKFKIVNRYVHTPARRFKTKGVWYMTKLALRSWWHRNNSKWFRKDHEYWQ